mmetsp:Transcript_33521/g.38489  ORF Transcript_33521/g.38489 Transcript_33521/m.38489 type:complete len:84 (+) Transcript_33521:412-663(+)
MLKNNKDHSKSTAYIFSGVLRLCIAAKKGIKDEVLQIGKDLLERLENPMFESGVVFAYKVIIACNLYSVDQDSVDQGELLKMK